MGVVFTTANRHGLVEIRAADVAGAVRLCLWRNLGVTWSTSDDRRHVARIRVRIVCDQAGVDDVRPCGPTPSFRLLRGLVATFLHSTLAYQRRWMRSQNQHRRGCCSGRMRSARMETSATGRSAGKREYGRR